MESALPLGCILDKSSTTLRLTSDPKERTRCRLRRRLWPAVPAGYPVCALKWHYGGDLLTGRRRPMMKRIAILLALAVVLLLAGRVLAMSSANYRLDWFVPLTGLVLRNF